MDGLPGLCRILPAGLLRVMAALFVLMVALPAAAETGQTVLRDIAYGSDSAQRLDVYSPANARGAPVIFMVHGGGWRRGDKAAGNVVENKVAHWLPRGYVFVSVNNRLMPDADPLQQADDVARALAFVQDKAERWGGDPKRIVLMGHSAGAHLVSLLASDPAIAKGQGARPWLGTIPLDSAAFDVVAIMEGRHFRLYDNAFGDDPAFWRTASPLHRLSDRPMPMLIICSSRRAVSCAQARGYAAKAGSLGGQVTVLPVDKSHGEINKDLGQPGGYTASVDSFLSSLGLP